MLDFGKEIKPLYFKKYIYSLIGNYENLIK